MKKLERKKTIPTQDDDMNLFLDVDDDVGKYIDLTWIPATSNACERLFSRAKIIFDDYRQSMTPRKESICIYRYFEKF